MKDLVDHSSNEEVVGSESRIASIFYGKRRKHTPWWIGIA